MNKNVEIYELNVIYVECNDKKFVNDFCEKTINTCYYVIDDSNEKLKKFTQRIKSCELSACDCCDETIVLYLSNKSIFEHLQKNVNTNISCFTHVMIENDHDIMGCTIEQYLENLREIILCK